METVSLVSSIVSVIIGGFAIWLSVTFYRLSSKISEDTKEAAKGISASVDRLESLFDRLYSDTFSMMKDTVSDMRKHIWPDKGPGSDSLALIERKADSQIADLRKQISTELSAVMQHVGRTDSKIHTVEQRMTELIDRAIQQTRRVESEAQEELSMSAVLNRLLEFLHRYGEAPLGRILGHSLLRRRFPRDVLIEALEILNRNEMISLSGSLDNLDTMVTIRKPPDEAKK